jgi:diaminohydroxyphosphoribosylaminopyrimidine deaminase/5-amino-6-(5-phosphoribosylamino)uracil reductase
MIRDGQAPTIIAATAAAPAERVAALTSAGAEVLVLPAAATGVDLRALWRALGERRLTSVLVEGGAAINAAALAANVIDKVYAFVAPKVFGGAAAPGPVGGEGADEVAAAIALEDMSAEPVGGDILITAYPTAREGRDVYRACGRIGQG